MYSARSLSGTWLLVATLLVGLNVSAGQLRAEDPAFLSPEEEAMLGAGDAALTKHQFREARRHYRQLLELRPDHPVALDRVALSHASEGDFDECIDHAARSSRIDSAYAATATLRLADCLLSAGRISEALGVYEQAIDRPDIDAELRAYAYGRKASVLYSVEQDLEGAFRALAAGIESYPTFAANHRMLATLLVADGAHLVWPFLANSFYLLLEPTEAPAEGVLEETGSWIITSEGGFGVYANRMQYFDLLDLPPLERHHLMGAYSVVFDALFETEFEDADAEAFDPIADLYHPFFRDLQQAGHADSFVHVAWQASGIDGITEWIIANEDVAVDFLNWAENWSGWAGFVAEDAGDALAVADSGRADDGNEERSEFRMLIEDVFRIGGVDAMVVGLIESGKLGLGDRVMVEGSEPHGDIVVEVIEVMNYPLDRAYAGDAVGVGLSGVSVDDLTRGDVLIRAPVE